MSMGTYGTADQQVIGIDLGGTAIKLGRFTRKGSCLQSLTVPTPQPPQPEAVLAAMVEAIAQLNPDQHPIAAIGVGTPGPTDETGKIARVAINLGWKDVPLAAWLEQKTGIPTILANDANCAGLGEYWIGAGRSFQNLILLTLGTGVGGAVILDGKLFTGRMGTAGELGLITLDWQGHACNSGNQGSLEQHVSVQAIRRRTGLEPQELGLRATAGDEDAIAFWKTYGCELAAGIASLLYILTPEAVIIGGGVSASANFFFPAVLQELERRVLPSSREGLQLLVAELGNQAGMVGAAKLAWDELVAPQAASAASSIDSDRTANRTADIAALKAELQRTQLAYQRAIEMAQFKGGFLARTSHELRSPLNAVISLHQLILADLADNPQEERDFITQANTSASKMLGLLDELIHVSKAEHGTMQPDIQPVQLVNVLQEVYLLTHLQAQNRNLRLAIDFPSEDLYVMADPRWLQQILVNLILNSITLMQEGYIRLSSAVEGDRVFLWLEDERPAESWSETIHLEERSTAKFSPGKPSPGLSLLANQTLLELMQGRLEIVEKTAAQTANSKCIQCSIPIVIAEVE